MVYISLKEMGGGPGTTLQEAAFWRVFPTCRRQKAHKFYSPNPIILPEDTGMETILPKEPPVTWEQNAICWEVYWSFGSHGSL